MLQSLKNIFVFTQGLTWLVFKKDFQCRWECNFFGITDTPDTLSQQFKLIRENITVGVIFYYSCWLEYNMFGNTELLQMFWEFNSEAVSERVSYASVFGALLYEYLSF